MKTYRALTDDAVALSESFVNQGEVNSNICG